MCLKPQRNLTICISHRCGGELTKEFFTMNWMKCIDLHIKVFALDYQFTKCLHRFGYFIQFLRKMFLSNPYPIPHNDAWGWPNLTLLCSSEHFMQFLQSYFVNWNHTTFSMRVGCSDGGKHESPLQLWTFHPTPNTTQICKLFSHPYIPMRVGGWHICLFCTDLGMSLTY